MTQYLDQTNAMPEYIPYPRFLLKASLTPTAKLIYAMLLDRYTLSRKNNWKDGEGHVYLVYTIEKLAEDIGMGITAVKRALSELSAAGLIRRSRIGFSAPSRIYIMIPDDAVLVGKNAVRAVDWDECERLWPGAASETKSVRDPYEPQTVTEPEDIPMTFTAPTVIQPSGEPSHSRSDDPHTDTRQSPNQTYSIHGNSNHHTQTSERAYGEFGNVMLTEAEYAEMREGSPDIFEAMLDFLSARIRDNQIPPEPHNVILRRMLEL